MGLQQVWNPEPALKRAPQRFWRWHWNWMKPSMTSSSV
jgi:hypothetical protein